MVVEEHMVCVAFNRMCCATYWFNPNILLHEKHYTAGDKKTGHESRSICKLNNAEISNVNITSQPDPLICDLQKRLS